MDFKNPAAPPAAKLLAKIASDVREIVQMDTTSCTISLVRSNTSMERVLSGKNHKIATLAAVADALGYEVIVRFREKPLPVVVRPRPIRGAASAWDAQ